MDTHGPSGPRREVQRGQEEDGLDLGLKRCTRLFMPKKSRVDIPAEAGVSIMNSGQTM